MLPATAGAQRRPPSAGEWMVEAAQRTHKAAREFEDDGYTLTTELAAGVLRSARTASLTLDLSDDSVYAFVAICDNGCGNLDLSLTNEDDEVVGEDTREDPTARISYIDVTNGRHRLEIKMLTCRSGSCRYALGVFSKPADEDAGNDGKDQALARVRRAAGHMEDQGYGPAGDPGGDLIPPEKWVPTQIALVGPGRYALIGGCDFDCGAVDLRVTGQGGATVAEAIGYGAAPILMVGAPPGDHLRVSVRIARCALDRCTYALGVYRK